MMALASHTPLNYMRLCREIFCMSISPFFDDVKYASSTQQHSLPDFHYRLLLPAIQLKKELWILFPLAFPWDVIGSHCLIVRFGGKSDMSFLCI